MSAPNKHGMPSSIQQGPTAAFSVTPSDSTDLAARTRMVWVGTSGDLQVLFADDNDDTHIVVLKNVAAGQWHHMALRRVLNGSTTAADIVAGW